MEEMEATKKQNLAQR